MRPPSLPVLLLFAACTLLGGGCAGMLGREPVRMYLVGLEPLEGQGLEMRFNAKLRLQNPNETEIRFDGLALDLELNGKAFATGVTSRTGSVPRFGETVIDVPVTVSALAAVRQALRLFADDRLDNVPYAMRGKLAGGGFGGTAFAETGTISLSGLLAQPLR